MHKTFSIQGCVVIFVKIKKVQFKVNKLLVTEACLHAFITCICTCFLCVAVKTELRHRVNENLWPAIRKQKINTFK